MHADEILPLAACVARHVRGRLLPGRPLPREEEEDWQAQAAYGICKALRYRPDADRRYLFGAGRRELFAWLCREWWRTSLLPRSGLEFPSGEPISAELVICESGWEPTDDQLNVLRDLLCDSRTKQGQRGTAAAEREVRILIGICRGWSNKEIGDDVGLSNLAVRTYRQRLVERLRALVRNQNEGIVAE